MGVLSIFNCSTSDLSGMFNPSSGPKDRMCLNNIKQKIFLEVDEMGANRRPFSGGNVFVFTYMHRVIISLTFEFNSS